MTFAFVGLTGVTLELWILKYEGIFCVEMAGQDDGYRVRLLLKLGAVEYERYTNLVLPKNPIEFSFEGRVITLTDIW